MNPTAAIHYHPDGYDTSSERLMGRHAAGEGFLKAYAADPDVESLHCVAASRNHAEDFARRVRQLTGKHKVVHWLRPEQHRRLAERGVVYNPGPGLGPWAWRRRSADQRGYSLCGVFHTTASHTVMDAVGDYLIAPLQPWDAVICPSQSIRATVNKILESWGEYLAQRLGAAPSAHLTLPVIPLGVDCDAFAAATRPTVRERWRRRLEIDAEDLCVLYVGRLSYHGKAHPLPMCAGLEQATRQTGKRVHLVHSGWFATTAIERAYRSLAERLAPSVRHVYVDGRRPEVRWDIWAVADVFTSLSDNIQETFGLTPIEAMASGLPVVVSDWDGYREAIRDGSEGFTVPTWQPKPGAGVELAELHASDRIDYDHYIGAAGQAVAVDIQASARAYTLLAGDPELRRRMGEAGRRRAREHYDWRRVTAQYRELWSELAAIREHTTEQAPRAPEGPAHPLRGDPFALFAEYPTRWIDEHTRLSLGPEVEASDLESLGRLVPMRILPSLRGGDALAQEVLRTLQVETCPVGDLLGQHPETRPATMLRALGWLAKAGVIRLSPPDEES